MKRMKNLWLIVVTAISLITFSSCSKDEGEKSDFSPALLEGEWFEDASEGMNANAISTTYFDGYGKVSMWTGYSTPMQGIYLDSEGSYEIKGNTLTIKSISSITGGNQTDVYEVKGLDYYTMTLYSASFATTSVNNRIIDTYNMNVGDNKLFEVGDKEFVPNIYVSTNDYVATVDNAGNIIAKKRGFCFVSATSSKGTAVIRINVSDPDNVVDDFMKFMMGSIDEVTATYGTDFIEIDANPLVERCYTFIDNMMDNVRISYSGSVVYAATVQLHSWVDKDEIVESLSKKYIIEGITNNYANFVTEIDGQKFKIMYIFKDGIITYIADMTKNKEYNFPADAFEEFDNLIMMGTANNIANAFHHEITEEEMEDGLFDVNVENDIFKSFTVIFNEDPEDEDYMKISSIMLSTKSGIKIADIEEWYKDHYEETGDEKNPYCSKTNPVYYIRFKQNSWTTVYYSYRKSNK